jgi:hypothetical protein
MPTLYFMMGFMIALHMVGWIRFWVYPPKKDTTFRPRYEPIQRLYW